MKRSYLHLLLLIIVAFSLECFRPTFISLPATFYKFGTYFSVSLFILVTYRNKNIGDKTLVYSIMLLSVCQLISAYNAYTFKGQALGIGILATMQGFAYIIFVPLCKSRIRLEYIERIVKIVSVAFLVCSVLNHLSPFPLFGSADETIDRGTTRFRLVGVYWVMLFLFMKVNRYAIDGKRSDMYWIIASSLGILLTLTRQDIAVSAFLASMLFFMKTKFIKKFTFAVLAFCLVSFVLPKVPIVKALIEKSIEERNAQEQYDNIRLVAADYYLYAYPRNEQQVLFGVGVPSFGNSSYGNQFANEQGILRVYREDVGYCGFYFNYGIIATLLLMFVFGKVIFLKLPRDYIYLKYYSAAFLILNVASAPSQNNVSIIPFVVALYMVVIVRHNERILQDKKTLR